MDLNVELNGQLQFILDLGVAIGMALLFGVVAVRLRQPAILGYLIAGIFIGPFTPGFVGDAEAISELADLGVVLLLFALGIEFTLRELRLVARVAVPGALLQIAIVSVVGAALAVALGIDVKPALVIGACLSISSTLVVIKLLIDRGELDSLHGRAAIGWAIVQDIVTIGFIVALPPLDGGDIVGPLLLALAKAAVFLALAFLVGTRVMPWLLGAVSRLGSSELFLLAVVAIALLTAFVSSAVFGLSLALGAFVAGIVVSESDMSYQAAAEVLPFRDLFAVLFFVSVGMLVDPQALLESAGFVALLVVIAVVGKGALTTGLSAAFGLPLRSALLLGAAMAQVGEFSFIIASDALAIELIDVEVYNLILGTAVVSILLSPLAIQVADRLARGVERRMEQPVTAVNPPIPGTAPRSRTERSIQPADDEARLSVVVLGGGRVGRTVVRAVRNRGFRCVVVDRDQRRLEEIAKTGAATLFGDAANPHILERAGLDRARVLVVAIGDPLTARLATERALRINPRLTVTSRARGKREIEELRTVGARRMVDPEAEAAFELARHALQRMGVSGPELMGVVAGLRRDVYGR
ncbi:MAG TPA: cation:proton antiporter family protein [Candidatus Limnocylindrales bacterium]|nr:cation:proton antiporter family protein [Candidatus Limnocylindrales bacterium]